MTFYDHFHFPHYFTGKIKAQIEHLYGSVAIGNLSQALITIFEPIFLYNVVNLTIPQILWFMAGIYALYAFLIPFAAKLVSKVGYSRSILFSVPFQVLYWFLILGSEQNVIYLVPAAIAFAIQKSLYWPALHASMAQYANRQQVGREFSMMYAIMNLMQIIGPMFGGFISTLFGINSVFIVASIIYFCSVIPLFWHKEKIKKFKYRFHDTVALYKKYPARFVGYFGFGEELLVLTIWPIFIYGILSSYQDTGALVTIATLIATGLGLYIGFYTDKHSKDSLIKAGTLIYALTWLARIPVVSPFAAFITDALSRTTKTLVFIPTAAVTYERAEKTQIMPYVVGMEQMLSIGKLIAAIVGIIIFTATGSFIALFIVAAIFSLFYFLI
jgi:MFS family permease